ncbi:MAG: hypothetical protein U5J97_05155 [Trueperaceae bacterium]|nr:hypothetical protein [Trueperaceae bacterium]
MREVAETTENPAVQPLPRRRRLKSLEQLGLDADAMIDMIEQVGNYGEIFARNLGPDTPFGIERGLNASYVDGGLLYSPPFR